METSRATLSMNGNDESLSAGLWSALHRTNTDVMFKFQLNRFSIFRVINVKSFAKNEKRSMIRKILNGREKKVNQDTSRTITHIVCEFQLNRFSIFRVINVKSFAKNEKGR